MASNIHALNPYLLQVTHIGQGNAPTGVDSFPERVTRWHELDIITGGNGVDAVFGKRYPVRAGDVFYRVPGLRNQHFFPYHCYFFVFDPYYSPEHEQAYQEEAVDAYVEPECAPWEPIAPFSFATEPYLGKVMDTTELVSNAFNLFIEFTSPHANPLRVKTMFLQLLDDVSTQLARAHTPNPQSLKYQHYRQRMVDVCNFIQQNPRLNHTLPAMAERVSLSPNFFCKVFHQLTGETLTQYVTRIKINYIKMQLLDTELSVSEIAHDCGYGDPTYLHTLFKKNVGCTPMEYRQYRMHGLPVHPK